MEGAFNEFGKWSVGVVTYIFCFICGLKWCKLEIRVLVSVFYNTFLVGLGADEYVSGADMEFSFVVPVCDSHRFDEDVRVRQC